MLEVVRGVSRGQQLAIPASECTLGRSVDADLRIDEHGVSRIHAKLVRVSPGLYNLIDLQSKNGTGVNGRRIDAAVLQPGDRIQLGPDVELRFGTRLPGDERPAEARRHQAEAVRRALTARQLQVAKLVAHGHGNREIAERLGLRVRTVESHLDHIYDQLQLKSRSALTRVLVEAGLLEA